MKKVTIVAAIIWTLSLVLAFIIKSGSPYLWIPDALLLAGFLPLLVTCRPSWPWLIFGLGNLIVGLVLEMTHTLPDTGLDSASLAAKQHLCQMHIPMVWIFFGLFSIAYGAIRFLKNVVVFVRRKTR